MFDQVLSGYIINIIVIEDQRSDNDSLKVTHVAEELDCCRHFSIKNDTHHLGLFELEYNVRTLSDIELGLHLACPQS